MGLARMRIRREPALLAFKLCGSGTGEGFTPRPNWQVWAILAVWATEEAARSAVTEGLVWRDWRRRSSEDWTVYLSPLSARGRWGGVNPFLPDPDSTPAPPGGPIAALTRATLRPRHLLRFWRRVPGISKAIGQDAHVLFKIGIGEMPLLHQVTFSIWPDAASMANFARADGPHAGAIRAVRDGDWFSEELYARFHILGTSGLWSGQNPLAPAQDTRTAA
jgi:spheroidene monooxygenase